MSKVVGIRGYFSKPKGGPRANSLRNTEVTEKQIIVDNRK